MHVIRITCATLAAFALFACDEPAQAPQPAAPAQEDQPSAAVIEPTETPGEQDVFTDTDDTPLTREELVGMWGLRSNCGQPHVFNEDGTYTDYTGATGQWSLQGDDLTMTRARGSFTDHVNQLNANAFAAGEPDGLMVIYQRC